MAPPPFFIYLCAHILQDKTGLSTEDYVAMLMFAPSLLARRPTVLAWKVSCLRSPVWPGSVNIKAPVLTTWQSLCCGRACCLHASGPAHLLQAGRAGMRSGTPVVVGEALSLLCAQLKIHAQYSAARRAAGHGDEIADWRTNNDEFPSRLCNLLLQVGQSLMSMSCHTAADNCQSSATSNFGLLLRLAACSSHSLMLVRSPADPPSIAAPHTSQRI